MLVLGPMFLLFYFHQRLSFGAYYLLQVFIAGKIYLIVQWYYPFSLSIILNFYYLICSHYPGIIIIIQYFFATHYIDWIWIKKLIAFMRKFALWYNLFSFPYLVWLTLTNYTNVPCFGWTCYAIYKDFCLLQQLESSIQISIYNI